MAGYPEFISRWGHLFENFDTSSLAFYRSVEAAVMARSVPETHWIQVEHKEGGLGSPNRVYMRIHRGKYAFDICAAPFGTGYFFSWWFTEPPLKFGLLYTIGFFLTLLIAFNVAFMVGAAFGAVIQGVTLSFLFGVGWSVFGVPALLWFLGSLMRQERIPGESTVLALPLVGRIYERIFAPPTFYSIDTALMFQDAVHNAVMEVIDCVTADKGIRALTEFERKPIMKRFGPSDKG